MVIDKNQIIGIDTLIDVGEIKNVPAKIDTGADSSSIWASDIDVSKDGVLSFKLFAPSSPFYTGETITRTDYKVAIITSSNGIPQIRYRTYLTIDLKGHKIKVLFSLADRKNNYFPVLIGRRTIKNKFFVDTSKSEVERYRNSKTNSLSVEFQKNPYKFHQKYIKINEKGAKK